MYESGEDYLENILILAGERGGVRSVDVAKRMGVSKPSVSRAVRILCAEGYLRLDGTGLRLTDRGRQKAEDIYARHRLLTAFFMRIAGITEEQAAANACRVEHYIDADIVNGIARWMDGGITAPSQGQAPP